MKKYKYIYIVCVLTWSLLGVEKSLGNGQIGLLYGFNSKFPTSIPTPFICRVPPRDNGVAFSIVTRMGSHIFGFLVVRLFVIFTVSKRTRMFVLQTESKVVSFNLKNGSIHENRK